MYSNGQYDYSRLLGKIREAGLTQVQLAAQMGLSACSLNLTLKNKREFRQNEIVKVAEILGIHSDEYDGYFFAHKL